MNEKTIRYVAKLVGANRIETHIRNLTSNAAFDLRKISEAQEVVYEVRGPKRNDDYTSIENINAELSKRAESLGLNVPTLVNRLSRDICNAQEGEKIALAGTMRLVIQASEEESSVLAMLDIMVEQDGDIEECVHQYCLLRFIWVANAMGMFFEGSVEQSVIQ